MKEDEIGGTFSAHEIINVSKILVGKPKGKITLEDKRVYGRIILKFVLV